MWKLKCRIGSYLYCLCSFGLIAQHANESILPSSGMQETTQQQAEYSVEEEYALKQDEHDPLSNMREKFHIPTRGGDQLIYLNGNSLGLQPCEVAADMKQEA